MKESTKKPATLDFDPNFILWSLVVFHFSPKQFNMVWWEDLFKDVHINTCIGNILLIKILTPGDTWAPSVTSWKNFSST